MTQDSSPPSSDRVFRSWVAEKACVLHVLSGTVGIATAFHEPGEYVSPINNEPVPATVFVLGEHSFLADDASRFVKLNSAVADVYIAFGEQLGELLKGTMQTCSKIGVDPEQGIAVIASVLREQLAKLGGNG
jgi:hypothetical protein